MKTGQLMLGDEVFVPNLLIADGIWSRMRGLLGRSGLPDGTGMLLSPCNSIHTVGMRFALDVIFLDRDRQVVRVVQSVRPNRFALGGRGAKSAVELAAGAVDLSRIEVGVSLSMKGATSNE